MKFTTPVTDFGQTFQIEPHHNILILGSCFANVVGQRLCDYHRKTLLNPFGTLYSPEIIFKLLNDSLDIAENKKQASEIASLHLFKANDGLWYSWMAASLIKGYDYEVCLNAMAEALQQTADIIKRLDVLILTFGTDHYYTLTENSRTSVANCHKMPDRMFEEKIPDISKTTSDFNNTYNRIKAIRPDMKTILTISPYRYLKYGLHQSKLSKARLLIAVEQCQQQYPELCYFPAYEILNDELRDYRFYAPDMVHPSEVTEKYIWQLFCENYISPRFMQFFKEWTPVLKARNHRQNSINTDLQKSIEKRIETIQRNFPEMF